MASGTTIGGSASNTAAATSSPTSSLTPEKIALSGENRQPLIIATTSSLLVITTIICWLRVYVRKRIVRCFGNDDWAMLVAWALVVMNAIISVSKVIYGSGLHIWLLNEPNKTEFIKLSTTSLATYQIAFAAIKVAFLIQYRRLFPLPEFQRICKWMMFFVIPFAIISAIVIALGCLPLAKTWDRSIPGTCVKREPWWYTNGTINLLTDLVIIILPMPLLHTLKLRSAQKLVLMGVFGLGVLVCGISIIRIYNLTPKQTSADLSYNTVPAGLWSIAELCCALICLCVPALKPLVRPWRASHRMNTLQYISDVPGSNSWQKGTGNTGKSASLKDVESTETFEASQPQMAAKTGHNRVFRASGGSTVGNDTIWVDDRDDPNNRLSFVDQAPESPARAKLPSRQSPESIAEEGNSDYAEFQRTAHLKTTVARSNPQRRADGSASNGDSWPLR